MTTLPEMFVEKREAITAHAVNPPEFDRTEQFRMAWELNEAAKFKGWSVNTWDLIKANTPFELTSSMSLAKVTGFNDWRDVTVFVQDDMCLDFFNLALAYCLKTGQGHKEQKGFIDGSGIGYVNTYTLRLKETLEKCFDAKWFFKEERPLVMMMNKTGMDFSNTANAIHPGHWSYPAGHGTKFLTAVEVLADVFDLDETCYRELLDAAAIAAMARSGSLIHYPIDNLAGGTLTTLKEFK